MLICCRYCGLRIVPTVFEDFHLFARATGDQDTFCDDAPVLGFHVPTGFVANRSLQFRPGTAWPKSKRQAAEWAEVARIIAAW